MSFRRWLLVVERVPPEDESGSSYRLWLRSLDGRSAEQVQSLSTVDELYEALLSEVSALSDADQPERSVSQAAGRE